MDLVKIDDIPEDGIIINTDTIDDLFSLPRDKNLYFYCGCVHHGKARSIVDKLLQNGYKTVYVIEGNGQALRMKGRI